MSQKTYSFEEEPMSYELKEINEWKSNDDNCINILINSNSPLPIEHIGPTTLKKLQEDAKKVPSITTPDLWFINDDGTFQFVEAKLDKKSVSDSQIAGLALLKKRLKAEVKIVRVHQSNMKVELRNHTDKFGFYFDLL